MCAGTVYEGSWANGKKHGLGTHTFPSGARYDGAYRNDKMDGQGTYTFHDGEWYSGSWKDDKMHGWAKLKEAGAISVVRHEHGNLISKGPVPAEDSAAALHVLQSGSFNSLSTASESALQMIEVTIVKARNLVRQDLFGLADPYAVLQLEEVDDGPPTIKLADWTAGRTVQYKTKTVRNSLDPEWHASFSFVVRTDRKYNLNLNVWDWDMVGSDDRMGDLTVPLTMDLLDSQERWHKLRDVRVPSFLLKKASTNAKMLQLQPHTDSQETLIPIKRSSSSGNLDENGQKIDKNSSISSIGGTHLNGQSTRDSALMPSEVQLRLKLVPDAHWEVTVLQARGLPKLDMFGKADPYCVLRWGTEGDELEMSENRDPENNVHWTGKTDNMRVKTSTKRNTLEPVWNDCECTCIHAYTYTHIQVHEKDG
jgi:Ca2+-dependent lipid-binding protein